MDKKSYSVTIKTSKCPSVDDADYIMRKIREFMSPETVILVSQNIYNLLTKYCACSHESLLVKVTKGEYVINIAYHPNKGHYIYRIVSVYWNNNLIETDYTNLTKIIYLTTEGT